MQSAQARAQVSTKSSLRSRGLSSELRLPAALTWLRGLHVSSKHADSLARQSDESTRAFEQSADRLGTVIPKCSATCAKIAESVSVPFVRESRGPHSPPKRRKRAAKGRTRRGLAPRGELHLNSMQPLKACVHNGRLVLDEPTDLPEGEVVYLQPVDGDDMSDEERETLHESIRESIEQMNRGVLIDADEALARLRAHR
jgi:hypothetical protein